MAPPSVESSLNRAPGNFRRNATLLSVSSLTVMSSATIAASLPGLQQHFSSQAHAGLLSRLVLTLPALFIALCAPFAGGIVDKFGRRPLLIGAVVLFALAGMSGLVLDSLSAFLVGRALLGVAVAGTMTSATALIGDYFHGVERERYMGLQAACIGIGGVVFLTGGGLIAELHWRAPFAVYGLALPLVLAAILFIREPSRASHQSHAGAVGDAGARSFWIALITLYVASVVNMIVFYMIPTQLPFYLQSLGIGSPSRIGAAIGLGQAVGVMVSLFYAPLRRLLGIVGTFAVGFGSIAVGFVLIGSAESYTAVLIGMAVAGISMGSMMPSLLNATLALAPPALRGRVSGGMTASIFAGQFASPFVSQPLVESVGFQDTYAYVGFFCGGLAVIAMGLTIYYGIKNKREATLAASRLTHSSN